MAAVNGSATATEDARYPSHLTSEWCALALNAAALF